MKDRVETVSTVLLAIAAVTTAWCSYQAARWNSEATLVRGTTQRLRFEAERAQGLSEAQREVDVATFIAWSDATLEDDPGRADFYEARFRDEFAVAMDAWLATDPFDDPTAPLTPFEMSEYQVASLTQAAELDQQASASSEISQDYIQRATNYVLGVVLSAVVLFLAGMSSRLSRPRLRVVLLVCAGVVYASALVWILSMPISFSI